MNTKLDIIFLCAVVFVGVTNPLAFGQSALDKSSVKKQAELRTWTDSTGKHTTEAEFVESKDGNIQLKKKDGSIINVPIEKLSENDQKWVKKQIELKNKLPSTKMLKEPKQSINKSKDIKNEEPSQEDLVPYELSKEELTNYKDPPPNPYHPGSLAPDTVSYTLYSNGKFTLSDEQRSSFFKQISNINLRDASERVHVIKIFVSIVGVKKAKEAGLVFNINGHAKYVWPKPEKK
ncbi:MAG: SHD1 domain-containing protein [Thermoguttaceae bacterium]|jgi:hypothetical protein